MHMHVRERNESGTMSDEISIELDTVNMKGSRNIHYW